MEDFLLDSLEEFFSISANLPSLGVRARFIKMCFFRAINTISTFYKEISQLVDMGHVRFLFFELVIPFLRSQIHRFSDDDGLSVVHLHWLSFNPLSFWVILSNFHGSLRGLYLAFSDFLLSLMDTNPHGEVLSL